MNFSRKQLQRYKDYRILAAIYKVPSRIQLICFTSQSAQGHDACYCIFLFYLEFHNLHTFDFIPIKIPLAVYAFHSLVMTTIHNKPPENIRPC